MVAKVRNTQKSVLVDRSMLINYLLIMSPLHYFIRLYIYIYKFIYRHEWKRSMINENERKLHFKLKFEKRIILTTNVHQHLQVTNSSNGWIPIAGITAMKRTNEETKLLTDWTFWVTHHSPNYATAKLQQPFSTQLECNKYIQMMPEFNNILLTRSKTTIAD
jgi:hypothetical protein